MDSFVSFIVRFDVVHSSLWQHCMEKCVELFSHVPSFLLFSHRMADEMREEVMEQIQVRCM